MATFSPSPAPRRTAGRYSSHGPSPSPFPPRRTRAGGSGPPSRFTTPIRQQEQVSVRDDESVEIVSSMDVDESSELIEYGPPTETIFAKSPELTATFYAHLPVEVKQALRNADFRRDAYTGDVDPLTGFAVVASTDTCYVWKYSQALTGTPTCYIFLCPRDAFPALMSTPFHALVPYSQLREPGLIVSSVTGQIRFWDSIGMGLAGGDNFSYSSLNLEEGENVTTLTRSDPQTYIASTSMGRLFRLIVTSSGGKSHLSSHIFSRPQPSHLISRLLPTLWSAPTAAQPEGGYISAVALGDMERDSAGRDVWALIDTRLQRWNMSVDGWEELSTDEELTGIVRETIREAFPSAPEDDIELDLELLDLKVVSSSGMVLLVSYAGQEDPYTMDMGNRPPRRIYAILRLSHAMGDVKVDSAKAVPYQSTSSSGAPMHPRLQLLADGSLYAIQFGDAVTFCAQESDYMDRLELKSATDRTLGLGVIPGESELLILTAATMMRAYIDVHEVRDFNPETGRANLIKSIMTQAILYGSAPENPLNFSFPPEVDAEALMSGAEQLSHAILESDAEVVRAHHDLQLQMIGRKERLSFLIKFINDNAVLTKMSQRSRQRLATDAEKLYAAQRLWVLHNESLQVLRDAVYAYMNAVGEGHHEDFMRAFFRLRVEDLGGLLVHVLDVIIRSSHMMDHNVSEDIPQANKIVLTILQSAVYYRQHYQGLYGVTPPLLNPWTSQLNVINIVLELFDKTTKLVESSPETVRGTNTPKSQLPDLASCLFGCIQERLEWLQSPAMAEDPSSRQEKLQVEDRFRQLRPEVLETLRRNNFADYAFKLAEEYRDFRSLASLCHRDQVYPPDQNPNARRIQAYVDKFKENFTTELYQWYIEHGELRTMFTQEQDGYMDSFFAEHPNPAISWIHDLGRGRYGLASQALLSEAEHATELTTKHLMLSIGKLSHLAQLPENSASIDQNVLDSFHDGLDFVSVHEALVEDLKSALAVVRVRQSLDMQAETIARSKASNLTDRKGFTTIFKQLARQLLQGKALSAEDIADVLSLKDNTSHAEDYTTALQILARAENLPRARRQSAFRNVWRRIFVHDDWDKLRQTADVTDADLNERLRNTALYAALQATGLKRHVREGYNLFPSEALEIPERAEIALRWPGLSPDEVDAIERDYERDSKVLADFALESIYQSLKQLVAEDEGWEDAS